MQLYNQDSIIYLVGDNNRRLVFPLMYFTKSFNSFEKRVLYANISLHIMGVLLLHLGVDVGVYGFISIYTWLIHILVVLRETSSIN
jgi:hypothetical protein